MRTAEQRAAPRDPPGEKQAAPRISDLPAVIASTAGKIELETLGDGDDSAVLDKMLRNACHNVFRRHFTAGEFTELVQRFEHGGFTVEVGDALSATAYAAALSELPGIDATTPSSASRRVRRHAWPSSSSSSRACTAASNSTRRRWTAPPCTAGEHAPLQRLGWHPGSAGAGRRGDLQPPQRGRLPRLGLRNRVAACSARAGATRPDAASWGWRR